MKCPNCGRSNQSDAKYCYRCGTSLAMLNEIANLIAAQRVARRLARPRKTAFGKFMDNLVIPVLKGILWMLLEITKALPRLLQSIIDGFSRI